MNGALVELTMEIGDWRQAEQCALVNKTSGAGAIASDLKYQRRYRERQRRISLCANIITAFISIINVIVYTYEDTTRDTKKYERQHMKKDK